MVGEQAGIEADHPVTRASLKRHEHDERGETSRRNRSSVDSHWPNS
jgi:hypothetical protein